MTVVAKHTHVNLLAGNFWHVMRNIETSAGRTTTRAVALSLYLQLHASRRVALRTHFRSASRLAVSRSPSSQRDRRACCRDPRMALIKVELNRLNEHSSRPVPIHQRMLIEWSECFIRIHSVYHTLAKCLAIDIFFLIKNDCNRCIIRVLEMMYHHGSTQPANSVPVRTRNIFTSNKHRNPITHSRLLDSPSFSLCTHVHRPSKLQETNENP